MDGQETKMFYNTAALLNVLNEEPQLALLNSLVNHFGKKSGEYLRATVLKCTATVDLLADVIESNYSLTQLFLFSFQFKIHRLQKI